MNLFDGIHRESEPERPAEGRYVGVTGFMDHTDVMKVYWSVFDHLDLDRLLMVGVLVSSKTLAGQTNKYPNRYPLVERIAGIFTEKPYTLNLIHFASDNPSTLGADLERLTQLGGMDLDGFQLNMSWPDPDVIARHMDAHPGHRMVLQLGRETLNHFSWMKQSALEQQVERLRSYRVTDLLLDASAGKGIPFDPVYSLELLRTLRGIHACGIAGGLKPETVPKLARLFEEFPDLSVDAEGGLRDAQDRLDVTKAVEYVEAVLAL